MPERAVIIGAGNVGRGFLGPLCSAAGFEVVFVDVDAPLIAALAARGAYTLRLVDNAGVQEVRVGPVQGILAGNEGAVADALAGAILAATAVGARALPGVAPGIAEGIRRRASRDAAPPLNIIVCENLPHAAATLRDLVAAHLSREERDYADAHIGFVDTVIGRMIPELPAALRAADPTLIIAEPYAILPVDRAAFRGPLPAIAGLEPADNFPVYVARKLYLHNAAHAVLAYLGYRRGWQFGYEALEDPEVRSILDGALEEALQGIVIRYGAEERWLRDHVADLLVRFGNRALQDRIVRLARDPLRKLAPEDRLVGAARVAETTGRTPGCLAWGIAGALRYDEPTDPSAVALQQRIASSGVASTLEGLCAIRPEEPLGRAVLERYAALGEQGMWT